MRRLMILVVVMVLVPVVAADYECIKNTTVVDAYAFDFLRTFQKTAAEVKRRTFDQPNRTMNFTVASKDTHRNVTMWSVCSLSVTDRSLCSRCIGLLIAAIYELCCEKRCPWGRINLRSDCYLGYSAPDYVISGWTDIGDLPKEVLKKPELIDFGAGHSIYRTRKLCLNVFLIPALLLFNDFCIGLYN